MQRKAIVIVPSEEDFKARTEAQEKAECKDVPDNAVMEMKGITTNRRRNLINLGFSSANLSLHILSKKKHDRKD